MKKVTLSPPLRLLLYFFVAILFYFIYVAASRGIADISAYEARVIMDNWAKGKKPVEKNDWAAAHQSLLSALESSPENPDYLALLGNLYEWRVANAPLHSPDTVADYRIALDYYRQALKKRPAFAFYWANIAVVKAILAEVDDEYYLALERALVLGAWEPGVQLKITDATLRVWYLLDDNGWKKMLANIEKKLKSNPQAVMEKAKQYQVLNKLCGKLRRTEPMLKYCR